MANSTTEQRIMDSTHKAIVKLTGTTDGASGQIRGVVIDVSNLAYAKNGNNILMTSNTDMKSTYRTYVKKVIADVAAPSGYVTLSWHGASSNTPMATFGNGFKELDFEFMGGLITNNGTTSNGDIIISTAGFDANNAYTLIIELKKDGQDYVTGFPSA